MPFGITAAIRRFGLLEEHFRFDPVNDDDAFNIIALIEHTGHATTLARERELRKYGISSRWAAALLVIWAMNNNATPTDISRWLLREPHSVTGLLDRMERDGYIHRFQDRQRRNVVRVAMTEKGREAYLNSLKRESYHRMAAVVDDEDRRVLRRILTKVWKAALADLGSADNWAAMAATHLPNGSDVNGTPERDSDSSHSQQASADSPTQPGPRGRRKSRSGTARG